MSLKEFMKQFEAIRNLINTHKKDKRAKENAFNILTKNQLFSKQMRSIQNCNILIVKILRVMLNKMRQKEINQVTKLIFLIIEQRVLHFEREINTKFLMTTIDIILILNHIIEMRKIKMTKKIFKKNEYDVEHLRLRQIMKEMIILENESEEKKKNMHSKNEKNDKKNANSKQTKEREERLRFKKKNKEKFDKKFKKKNKRQKAKSEELRDKEKNKQENRTTKTQIEVRISIDLIAIAFQFESHFQSKSQIIVKNF